MRLNNHTYEQMIENVICWEKTPRGGELDCGAETCRVDTVFL